MSKTNEEQKSIEIKGAIILTPELAQRILAVFDELPRRHSPLIDPVLNEFVSSPRADVKLDPPKAEVKEEKKEK